MAVALNVHDLRFILDQIRIAEAHAAGTPLADLVGNLHLPYGLRTVDGSYNNLVEGRERWGAADEVLPRMFTPYYRDDQDGDSFDPDGPGPAPSVTNTNYGNAGNVADSDPRLISNLISDQTAGNPAAISAALTQTGYEGDKAAAVSAIHAAWDDFEAGNILRADFEAVADGYGLTLQGDSLVIPNTAPDEGLSSPFNAWMTFFGQFFDHGLDLIPKGGNGTVYVPLHPDDPLYDAGPDGIAGTADDGHTNFMVLTRAEVDENGETKNVTTPLVDQNQTYTSHASHQVFLREYVMEDGVPKATGHLLEGQNGGLATWADVKAQALNLLGIVLSDKDIAAIPMVRTDAYGNFIPGPDGFPMIVTGIGPDGIPNTDDDEVASGTPAAPVHLMLGVAGEVDPAPGGLSVVPVRISNAFLDDIAHNAAPVIVDGNLVQDADADTGNAVASVMGRNTEYDNELLDRHFITGDGRGNENIGLTAVHHVFHSEHNRQVDANKLEILKSGDLTFINEWLEADITQGDVDALAGLSNADIVAFGDTLNWDGERLFQVGRFATEMQYQHLVFEEFGRRLQPNIDPFVFNTTTDIDPAIFAEFAHVVYRFGHSMLTEEVTRLFLNADGEPVSYDEFGNEVAVTDLASWGQSTGLIEAFLNPVDYDLDGAISAEQAAGAVFRGLNLEHGNHIDEFVTDALRNNLLGLPLDLAAINIARGRDTGMPTLNQAREQLFDASGSTFLTPYESWADFAENLKNPMSVINFIAAYGTHQSIIDAGTDAEARRDAATALVLGVDGETAQQTADRLAFLNGPAADTGVDDIDMWIGGLAERPMAFGGFLGSTFNAVFEAQMEILQDNDRFYYLSRTQGLNFLNELENNAFSKLVMANTDQVDPGPDGIRGTSDDLLTFHTHVDSFTLADYVLNVDPTKQLIDDPMHGNPILNAQGRTMVQRDNPNTPEVEQNYLKFVGADHLAINGTNGDDIINSGGGDDGIWGGAGNDRIEGGHGVDLINGGAGNDIITDSGDSGDFIKGDEGHDVIANSNGLDVLMGGDGKDAFIVGVDTTEVFGGEGDDFILGGDDADFLLGNEGDDWIEGGGGFDTTAGDNSELFFNSTIIGHDVMFAGDNEHDFDSEAGDDIMVQGVSVMRNEGMTGFDWASHQDSPIAADTDMSVSIFANDQADVLRNRFDQTEGLSGSDHDDILRGDDRGTDAVIDPEVDMVGHELTQAGVDRIEGLREVLGLAPRGDAPDDEVVFDTGNILLGGAGSDLIEGRAGDDVIDGDHRLHVRISIMDAAGENEIATVTSLKDTVLIDGLAKPLTTHLLQGRVSPEQMHIVREIVNDGQAGDEDTAAYYDDFANYDVSVNEDGSVRVAHVNPTDGVIDPVTGRARLSDGVDRLTNVEFLQFADQTVRITDIVNFAATGIPMITNQPTLEGRLLGLDTSMIQDANGLGAFSYQWQQSSDGVTWTDIDGANGETFRPIDLPGTEFGPQADQFIRAAISFTDAAGNAEQVFTDATDPTGARWRGTRNDDQFEGTAGFDVASGGFGNDVMNGHDGADRLNGQGDNDTIDGGAGDDFLRGGIGDDVLTGGAGDDYLLGNDGIDTMVFDGAIGDYRLNASPNFIAVVDDIGDGGWDRGGYFEILRFGGVDYEIVTGTNDVDATLNGLSGAAGNQVVFGLAGSDMLVGGLGDDYLHGGTGRDTFLQNAATDGRDFIDGGAAIDSYLLTGDATAELFQIYTADAAAAAGLLGIGANAEIVVVRNGEIITEMTSVEEIQIDGGGGGDTFEVFGDFTGTSLAYNTIRLEGSSEADTVDIRGLVSSHRVILTSGGGNDRFLGEMRDQDRVIFEDGSRHSNSSLYRDSDDVFWKDLDDKYVAGTRGSFLDGEDLEDLLVRAENGVYRDASGFGNNESNPTWGAAGENFIRLTDAHFTDGASGIRQTALTAREISDIVSNQDNDGDGIEEDIPNEFGGSALLTFFGQYFDHGLDFVAKGNPGYVSIGTDSFPISAPRSNIVEGTGVDPDGIPNTGDEIAAEYVNHASPYVDQNQAYGSSDAITDLLREWVVDESGEAQQTAYLLGSEPDSSGYMMLPTVADVRENYRIMTGGEELTADDIQNYGGSGQPLLIDFIPTFITPPEGGPPVLDLDALDHYYVAGDGRANENVMLTSIHTIWARNHNWWVDTLREQTGDTWTEEEYFQAARMMNIAEYQQIVFTEFATAMAGGFDDDEEHGFDGYDPTIDASISVEFAQAAYRFGHSMLNEDLGYLDADGNAQRLSLVEAFLKPEQVGALGVDGLLAGAVADLHQAIDVDMVNALRNQLVGRPLDLAALNIFRGRDMGIAPFNEVREQLFAQTGKASLEPYTGWDDFQARNDLSDDLIAQLQEAYPDGFETMDLWIGGLAEKPRHGQLGSTLGYIFLEQLDRLQNGDRMYYLETFDDQLFAENVATFSKIIERNSGLTDLPENVFQPDGGTTTGGDDSGGVEADGGTGSQETELVQSDPAETPAVSPVGDTPDLNVTSPGGPVQVDLPGSPATVQDLHLVGGEAADAMAGGDGNDILDGGAGNDRLDGGAGADTLIGGAGNDTFVFGDGDTVLDFVVAEDRIDLSTLGVTAETFAGMVAIVQDGDDTVVSVGSGTMVLRGVDASSLDASSFQLWEPRGVEFVEDAPQGSFIATMAFSEELVALPSFSADTDAVGDAAQMLGSRSNGQFTSLLEEAAHGGAILPPALLAAMPLEMQLTFVRDLDGSPVGDDLSPAFLF